jgi:hypothetical protein
VVGDVPVNNECYGEELGVNIILSDYFSKLSGEGEASWVTDGIHVQCRWNVAARLDVCL